MEKAEKQNGEGRENDDQEMLQGWRLVWRQCSPSLIYAGIFKGHHHLMAHLRSLAWPTAVIGDGRITIKT